MSGNGSWARRLTILVAALTGACASGGPEAGGPAGSPEQALTATGPLVYVANQDDATVSVVDAGTLEVVATVDLRGLGFGATSKPHHIAVEPDGTHWYVSLIGANRVLKLDRSNRLVGQAEFEVPGMLALDPRSDLLLVGRSMSAVNPPERIGVIERSSMDIEELPVFYPRPHALTVHPRGAVAYSASLAENSLAVVEPMEEEVGVQAIEAPSGGQHSVHTVVQFAVSPDGRTLVGTGEMSGKLLVFDLGDPTEPRLTRQVDVGARPWHPVFSPDGSEVWFANKGANTVSVVETATWTVADVISDEALAEPHGSAFSPDGSHVFISSNNLRDRYPGGKGTLTVIDAATRQVVKVLIVGGNAAGVGTNAPR
jgi:YVTN family beta-propeller protein